MSDQLLLHPLAALRAQLGLTGEQYLDRLDDVHYALGYGRMAKGRQKVSRWENGVNSPEMPARYAMARLHGIRCEAVVELGWPNFLLLAFPDDRPILDSPWTLAGTVAAVAAAARGGSMVDRRGFLIASGAALGGLATSWSLALAEPAAALPDMPAATTRLSPALLDVLEQRLDDLRRLDDVLGGARLRQTATAEYELLKGLASQTGQHGPLEHRLLSLLAESARMCGWLQFDAGHHARAQRFYITALRASASAGDHQVGANTLAFMAIQVYSKGNPQDAVDLVRTAQDATTHRTTPRVRSMLHARAARALSKTGDRTACWRELDAARSEYARGPHDDDPPWSYWLNAGEIEMLAGSAALDLNDPHRALDHFARAHHVRYAADGFARDHVLYLTRTARAHLQLGDLDAACAVAAEAFTQNTTLNSSRPSDALDDLRDELEPHRHIRAVQDFLLLSA
ncbi:transcriptional regulator [Streptomyces ipomoeae]|uniref:transcriptional regulator n=1 Tax=Streptomyces ipomoeae TaxID=103232 RepID=UPI001146675B|nr:transcriptional regulator [Streptomyces ipomoeae]TQE33079.1 transcriptional regulator [Streptomyces ipomoeae]